MICPRSQHWLLVSATIAAFSMLGCSDDTAACEGADCACPPEQCPPSFDVGFQDAYGGNGNDTVGGLARDGGGDLYLAGGYGGPFSLGGSQLMGGEQGDWFLASFDRNGAPRWAKGFGGFDTGAGLYGVELATGVAVGGDGSVSVAGFFSYVMNVDGLMLTAVGDVEGFVASFSSDGSVRWANALTGMDFDTVNAVASDASGNVFVTGAYDVQLSPAPGTVLDSVEMSGDVFVSAYDANGAHKWSKSSGGMLRDAGHAIAADADGNVYVAGIFEGSAGFGGQPYTAVGANDVFLTSYAPDGSWRWDAAFGAMLNDSANAIAITDDGYVVVGGQLSGATTFGGVQIGVPSSISGFVLVLDQNGAYQWSKSFAGTSGAPSVDSAHALGGQIAIGGVFTESADFGAGPLSGVGALNPFVSVYDTSGTNLWSHAFGAQTATVPGVALAGDEKAYFAGSFRPKLSAETEIFAQGEDDTFLAGVRPQ